MKYKIIFENEIMKITRKQISKDDPIVLIRAEVILEASPDVIFQLIHNLEWRVKWDKVLSKMRIVEKINDETDYLYSFLKSPMGVSNRDFL